jgi:hypothetical protein
MKRRKSKKPTGLWKKSKLSDYNKVLLEKFFAHFAKGIGGGSEATTVYGMEDWDDGTEESDLAEEVNFLLEDLEEHLDEAEQVVKRIKKLAGYKG